MKTVTIYIQDLDIEFDMEVPDYFTEADVKTLAQVEAVNFSGLVNPQITVKL